MSYRPRRPSLSEPTTVPTGQVTAITASPRAAGRFDLVVDGNPVARLSIEGIERLRLRVGQQLSDQDAARVGAEADVQRTYDRAVAMLASRGRAAGELRRLLLKKGEAASNVDTALARLRAVGFVDDESFSRQFARYRASAAGWSRRRIERELTKRGVDRTLAASIVGEVFAEEGIDDRATIQREAERKLRTLRRVDEPTRRRRLYGFLARRGYDPDSISSVMRGLKVDPAE